MGYLLHQLLTRSAARCPDQAAVSAGGRTLTYRELDEQSNQLAHVLRSRGLRKGDRVGMFFPKSVESLIAMLGIGKAGGVYVPMDPQQPVQRAAYVLENCAMAGVIASPQLLQALGTAVNVPPDFAIVTGEVPAGSEWCPAFPWSSVSEAP